jgi:hypothetical protein
VEDRDLKHLRDVRRVRGRTSLLRRRRETDLVVHDDVNRPAHGVRVEQAHVERFLNHALAGNRRVAVDQNRDLSAARHVADAILLRPRAPKHDRIHELEVARVEAEGEVHLAPARRHEVRAVPHVVLHVAAAEVKLGVGVLELAENVARALAHDVGEHVQAAAMGHSEHDLVHSMLRRTIDGEGEERNQALRALERKTLRAHEFLLDELFEDGGVRKLREDSKLLDARELDTVFRAFHPILEPVFHTEIVDVHELHADRTAVRVPEPREDRAQREHLRSRDGATREAPVEIGGTQAVKFRIELGLARARKPERVDLSNHMPTNSIGSDECVDLILTHRGFRNAMRRHRAAIRRRGAVRARRRRAEEGTDAERRSEFRFARKVRVLT